MTEQGTEKLIEMPPQAPQGEGVRLQDGGGLPAASPGTAPSARSEAPALAVAPEEKVMPEEKKKTPTTPGWRLLNIGSYFGLGFGANVAVSFTLGRDEVMFKSGKPTLLPEAFHNINVWLNNQLLPKFTSLFKTIFPKESFFNLPNKSEAAKMAGIASGITTAILLLSWGGTLLFGPIKWVEDHKPQLVRSFDKKLDGLRRMFGGGPKEKELEERKEAYKYLDSDQAKEPWPKLLVARYFSVGVLIAGVFAAACIDPSRKGLARLEDAFFSVAKKYEGWRNKKLEWLGSDVTKKLVGMGVLEGVGSGFTALCAFLKIKYSELTGKRQAEAEKASQAEAPALLSARDGGMAAENALLAMHQEAGRPSGKDWSATVEKHGGKTAAHVPASSHRDAVSQRAVQGGEVMASV